MSIVFVPQKLRGNAKINQETIQRLLDENDQLIRCIFEYMQKGRAVECVKYQQFLHRNIVYLATLADASPDDDVPSTSTTTWQSVTVANKAPCVPAGTTNPEAASTTLPHQS
ncbi:SS18-like protein 2 [Corythoichthys intestinalis]|uniref:SS18-like protein 2 n=1 Tax=Corythoichthys intestinalis TaxID=161448 RepID=UPI0025A511A7|nr:SS18-like protein 2 [Corythoichthys intestinalis]XP_061796496.1 SS18-like protein 2 [Nerophis lumbriciformis]